MSKMTQISNMGKPIRMRKQKLAGGPRITGLRGASPCPKKEPRKSAHLSSAEK